MKKFLKYTGILLLVIVLTAGTYGVVTFPPIIAGMGAKVLCSCVYGTGRSVESVQQQELKLVPVTWGSFELHPEDSSATGHFLWRTSKAIYRKGLGCTLLAQRSEEQLRAQAIALPVKPHVNADTIPWPSGDLVKDTLPAGVNYEAIRTTVRNGFTEPSPESALNTHAVVVLYKGHIIAEEYAAGFDRHSPMMGWSMTKSIMNALVGLLVKDGKLNVDAPALVAEWNDDRKNITLNDLLHASSGLAWSESYFTPGDFHNMFTHSDDKGGYAAAKPLEAPPNTLFEYSSGTSNLISKIIRQTVGDSAYYKFPYERLFNKIGMRDVFIEPDASGTFVGSSYGYASARDWARFGLLYLNDGVWNGERILPEGWVKYTTTPAPAAPLGEYGA
ncbi:MAG: serine hydrolase, partial [Bacteroidia bacterium]|nr:serine hydrolase [Bacteroidia bacterium]